MADCTEQIESPPAVAPSINDRNACKLFRIWEAEKFFPWLISSFPKICTAVGLANKLYDATKFKGTYDTNTIYNLGESVVYGDKMYVSLSDNNPSTPPNTSWYQLGGGLEERVDDIEPYIVPQGGIIMWSGAIATIPSGWALCDGNNGTPDLRDRFVVGAGSTYNRGATGGSKDAVVVAHSHSISHDHPNVATTTNGNHRHWHSGEATKYNRAGANGGACYAWYFNNCNQGGSTRVGDAYTGYAGNHKHYLNVPAYSGNSGTSGTSGTNKNLPPYYALAFIMKL